MSRAKDGIKMYLRVLGGFSHILYGEADACGTEPCYVLYEEHIAMHM
jgi:hypothetical protein